LAADFDLAAGAARLATALTFAATNCASDVIGAVIFRLPTVIDAGACGPEDCGDGTLAGNDRHRHPDETQWQ
jgi:hypothetical protein